MKKKRSCTIYSKSKGGEIATGVEICEGWKSERDDQGREIEGGKVEGRVCLRFFISDGSKQTFRFIAEPKETYALFLKMNKAARTEGKFKEQTAPHTTKRRESGGQQLEIISSVTVEKWVNGTRAGYAIIGSRTVNGKSDSFNVSISSVEDWLFYAEFLKSLSISQSWESYEGNE